jgi:hypothetical protein
MQMRTLWKKLARAQGGKVWGQGRATKGGSRPPGGPGRAGWAQRSSSLRRPSDVPLNVCY